MQVKLHFNSLDGLRGVAALAVLLGHIRPANGFNLTPRHFLAVDFFFALSGFVIASAYDERLARGLSLGRFTALRLIRLYPLIVLGLVLGAVGFARLYPPSLLATLFATGLFLIPTPLGASSEDQMALALNPPSWSLLWEFLANMAYALARPVLNWGMLLSVIALSAIVLVASVLHFDTLDIGSKWPSVLAGAPRVGFSFFAGVALFRARRWPALERFRIPLVPGALILAATIMLPVPAALSVPVELVAVVLIFPALVAGCANAAPGRLAWLCTFLGASSYPVYVLQSGILPHLRGLPDHLHLGPAAATAVSVVLAALFLAFAWIVLRLYDEPVRAWLTRKAAITPVRAPAATVP